jgi:hypothetical protein
MPAYSVHKASDLAGNETTRLPAYRSHDAPADGQREALRREIVAQAQEIGLRAGRVTGKEIDSLVDHAIEDLRGRLDSNILLRVL